MTAAKIEKEITKKEIKETIDSFKEVRYRAMVDEPFYGSLAVKLELKVVGQDEDGSDNHIKIAATDAFYLYLNPKGWLPLKFWEKLFVMKHEILHCVLRHPSRVSDRHPYLWNVACDFVINGIIANSGRNGEKNGKRSRIMDNCIQPRDEFRGKDAGTVYQMLAKELPPKMLLNPRLGDKPCGEGCDYTYVPKTDPSMAEAYAKHFKADPHGYMQPMEKDIDSNNLTKDQISQRTQQCDQEWRSAAKQAMDLAKARGHFPLGVSEIIEREQKPLLPWERLLQQWITSRTRGGYNWNTPSKRFIGEDIYVPGRIKRALKKTAIAVDTSGSVSSNLLGKFLGEVAGVLGIYPCDLDLVGIDAEVSYIGRFKNSYDFPNEVPIKGRGGTSFVPFFKWMLNSYDGSSELGEMPEVVIYFTDGMGDYPKKPIDGVHVLWVMSMNHQKGSRHYPPFGDVIVAFDDPTEGA